MGLRDRLFHREQEPEANCPRCEVPSPAGTITCAACGWDLRESYHDPLQPAAAERPGPAA
jgi:hypothetical protein